MATVRCPKPSEEEVSALQGRLVIEAVRVASDSEEGLICGPLDPMVLRSLADVSRPNAWMESMMASPASERLTREDSRFRFFCCCPLLSPRKDNEKASGTF